MVKFLLYITKGFHSKIAAIILLDIAEVSFSLCFVWFSKKVIDIATGVNDGDLYMYSAMLLAVMILQISARLLSIKVRTGTEVRLGNHIRYKMFSHLLYTRWKDLSGIHSGDLLTRIVRDTDEVQSAIINTLPLIVSSAIKFTGALIFLYILDPVLALIIGVSMPLMLVFSRLYYKLMRTYTHKAKETESKINSFLQESLINHTIIKTFERQEYELSNLSDMQERLKSIVKKKTNISVFTNAFMSIAFNGSYVIAFIWSAFGLAKKTIVFGTVTAYLQLVARMQNPLFDLLKMLPAIIAAKASAERLAFLTGFETEKISENQLLSGNVKLSIDHLDFSYDKNEKPILEDFSLRLMSGSIIAIMGKTGVGKTTLVRLLLALLKPDKGSIFIEDEFQKVLVSENTRSNFIYVPQGNSLFSGSIRDNLLIGNPDADDSMLSNVLNTASASFVFELPEGLDTFIGEKGLGLSEGQAQRLAIARSLLRPGKIILLDEATSSLDSETAFEFITNLKAQVGNRIVIFITHQLEVAKHCDTIVNI